MKRLIIWLAILLPLFANAQIWDGGTLQRNRTDSTVRGNFGSRGLKTIPTVLGTSVQGQLLQYSAANNAWVPYTIPIDGATGIISGGTITGLGGANAIVASGTGTILDNTNPASPALYELSWVTDTIWLTDNATNYLYYDSLGVLNATIAIPNPANFRTRVYLGRAQKTSGSITSINGAYVPIQQAPASIKDMFTAYGLTKTGLVVSPASTNLTIAVASGGIFSFGANFQSSVLNPNNLSYTANSPQTFRMVTAGNISSTDITVLPVGSYNPTGTTISAIGGGANESTIFTVYKFPTTGNVRVLYGQTTYSSLANAVQAIGSYIPNPPAVFSDAIIIGYIAAVKTATDLSNTSQAVFVTTNKFGGVGGGFASSALTNYVQKTGDTMTGTLNGTDIILSNKLTATKALFGDTIPPSSFANERFLVSLTGNGQIEVGVTGNEASFATYNWNPINGASAGKMGVLGFHKGDLNPLTGNYFSEIHTTYYTGGVANDFNVFKGGKDGVVFFPTSHLNTTEFIPETVTIHDGDLKISNDAPKIDMPYVLNENFKHTIIGSGYSATPNLNLLEFKVASGSGTQSTPLTLKGDGTVGDLTVTDQINFTGSGSNISGNGNGLILQSGSNGMLTYINGAYRGIFNGSGNLLIGSLTDHAGERLQITGDAYVSGNITASNLSSGTYTPTLTNGTNVASSSNADMFYQRVGNMVSYTIFMTVITTASGSTQIDFSLPVASNFSSSTDLKGTSSYSQSIGNSSDFTVSASIANDRAVVTFNDDTGGGGVNITITGHYKIL